jgi:hypothetical protein
MEASMIGRTLTAVVMAAALAVSPALAGASQGLQAQDRAASPSEAANDMMGMSSAGWLLVLGLIVMVGVIVNEQNDRPSSP